MAMTLVSTTTVGSGGAASIEFTGIPQTGKDLLVLLSGRGASNAFAMRFNSNSSSIYSMIELSGDGSSTFSQGFSNLANFQRIVTGWTSNTANTFGNTSIYVSNYATASAKSASVDAVNENNATAADQRIMALSWNNTAAITSMILFGPGNLWSEFTTASLYIIS